MESNLIVWSLNQLKIGLWEDVRLLFGNTSTKNGNVNTKSEKKKTP